MDLALIWRKEAVKEDSHMKERIWKLHPDTIANLPVS
jgi:hypothetical protein